MEIREKLVHFETPFFLFKNLGKELIQMQWEQYCSEEQNSGWESCKCKSSRTENACQNYKE